MVLAAAVFGTIRGSSIETPPSLVFVVVIAIVLPVVVVVVVVFFSISLISFFVLFCDSGTAVLIVAAARLREVVAADVAVAARAERFGEVVAADVAKVISGAFATSSST